MTWPEGRSEDLGTSSLHGHGNQCGQQPRQCWPWGQPQLYLLLPNKAVSVRFSADATVKLYKITSRPSSGEGAEHVGMQEWWSAPGWVRLCPPQSPCLRPIPQDSVCKTGSVHCPFPDIWHLLPVVIGLREIPFPFSQRLGSSCGGGDSGTLSAGQGDLPDVWEGPFCEGQDATTSRDKLGSSESSSGLGLELGGWVWGVGLIG